MQTLPERKDAPACTCTMEERLSRLGAKLDDLVKTADETKDEIAKRGSGAVKEFLAALKKIQEEFIEIQHTAKDASERVTGKLFAKEQNAEPSDKPVPCSTEVCPHHGQPTEADIGSGDASSSY